MPSSTDLTPREREVLAAVAEGLTSTRIAPRLEIAVGTVDAYVKAAMRKLGAGSRREAVVMAIEQGLIPERSDSHARPFRA